MLSYTLLYVLASNTTFMRPVPPLLQLPKPRMTHPIKEDVKEKILFPPLAGEVDVWLASSPVPFVEEFFVFGALDRRVLLRRCQPQLLVSRKWFRLAVGA
jgi:hypothetical protein